MLQLMVIVAVLIPSVGASLGPFAAGWHWGKVMHASESLVLGVLVGLLWLGYRDHHRLDIPTPLVTLAAMTVGVAVGVFWELGAFALDWILKWDLQASNTDTMTDFLWMDLAAIAGALLAARLYREAFSVSRRREVAEVAAWLTCGPAGLVDRHPRLVGAALGVVIVGYVALLWLVDRSLPGLPTG
jgi:hypothetical protein